jgi:hypothetical protein
MPRALALGLSLNTPSGPVRSIQVAATSATAGLVNHDDLAQLHSLGHWFCACKRSIEPLLSVCME